MTRHRFEVLDSELLVDAPIIGVRRDTVTMPGGSTATREIVEHFGAAAIVALDDEGRIAMVEQYRHSVKSRLWELPAGILDIADEDALACAQRELEEEAGLAAESWELLTDIVASPGYGEEVVRIYLARDLREVERPAAEDDEEADMDFAWVPIEKAVQLVMSGTVSNSIALAGIMTAAEVIAGRHLARSVDTPFEMRPTSLADRRQAEGIVPDMKKRQ